MKTKLFFLSLVLTGLSVSTLFAQTKTVAAKKPVATTAAPSIPGKTKVKITTDMGVIVVKLYDATPKHRDNFIKLVKEGFYDSYF